MHLFYLSIRSISISIGHENDSPGPSSRDHRPLTASESTGAVDGSIATQTCLGPDLSGHPP
jgi:hypothetical protein